MTLLKRKADFRRRFEIPCILPALALLLLTACGKAELTGISLQPVTVQAGNRQKAAVQYETAGKASDTAIQTAVDANHWTWQTGDENIATVNSQGVVTGLHRRWDHPDPDGRQRRPDRQLHRAGDQSAAGAYSKRHCAVP